MKEQQEDDAVRDVVPKRDVPASLVGNPRCSGEGYPRCLPRMM